MLRKGVQTIQKRKFTGYAYKVAKGMMPKISETERAALNAGTVGFDRNIFSGNPTSADLKNYSVKASAEEQAFLDKEVNELSEILDDHKITETRDMPEEFWIRCKKQGFFGMIIPKQYGGKGFSAHGHSQVVQKISTRSGSAAGTVTVPNSLGPGELLLRYGTEEQKNYFLPCLASGDLIPCFDLTAPHSGSNAASMSEAYGEVVERNGQLASFNKRYITLAPVAGVVGLAFSLKDPKGLLKGTGNERITIALLERDHRGQNMGRRHDPLVASFMNGTVTGTDVFIPMKSIIGGQNRCGFGWNMLMDCLAEGRSVSLPASAVGAARASMNAINAYARVRKQFRVPIAEMGGVQEALGRIFPEAYKHEQPAVLSAVVKYQTTARARVVVNNKMTVMGGAGIYRGLNNFLGTHTFQRSFCTSSTVGIDTQECVRRLTAMKATPELIEFVRENELNGHVLQGFDFSLPIGTLGYVDVARLRLLSRELQREGKEASAARSALFSKEILIVWDGSEVSTLSLDSQNDLKDFLAAAGTYALVDAYGKNVRKFAELVGGELYTFRNSPLSITGQLDAFKKQRLAKVDFTLAAELSKVVGEKVVFAGHNVVPSPVGKEGERPGQMVSHSLKMVSHSLKMVSHSYCNPYVQNKSITKPGKHVCTK